MYETTEAQFLGSESTELHVREAMAQWQRVGFQTRRLGVRIPLASFLFPLQAILFLFLEEEEEKLNKKKKMPKLGIAPRLPRPQRGVLLLDYFGMWRIRVSIPVLNLAKVVCYHVQQSPMCVHRDSNPNLILGRDKYYPCTMDACYLSASRNDFL